MDTDVESLDVPQLVNLLSRALDPAVPLELVAAAQERLLRLDARAEPQPRGNPTAQGAPGRDARPAGAPRGPRAALASAPIAPVPVPAAGTAAATRSTALAARPRNAAYRAASTGGRATADATTGLDVPDTPVAPDAQNTRGAAGAKAEDVGARTVLAAAPRRLSLVACEAGPGTDPDAAAVDDGAIDADTGTGTDAFAPPFAPSDLSPDVQLEATDLQ